MIWIKEEYTHRSEVEHEAGEEEATTNKTDLKWIHEDDEFDEFEDDDEEDEVWLRLRAFINLLEKLVVETNKRKEEQRGK